MIEDRQGSVSSPIGPCEGRICKKADKFSFNDKSDVSVEGQNDALGSSITKAQPDLLSCEELSKTQVINLTKTPQIQKQEKSEESVRRVTPHAKVTKGKRTARTIVHKDKGLHSNMKVRKNDYLVEQLHDEDFNTRHKASPF